MYYFALMRDIRDGYFNLGNASLFEYRHAPAVAGYALFPQGILATITTLDLTTIILFGDLFFPAVICFLLFLLFRRCIVSDVLSALLSFAFMAWWGTGWQRSMNPQVTMTFFLLALLLCLSDPDGKKIAWRGFSLFFLLFVQPIYAAYIVVLEGLDALFHWKKSGSFLKVFWQRLPLAMYICAALILLFFLRYGADALILSETYARRGLIPSYLPAAPLTQLYILCTLLVSLWVLRRNIVRDSVSYLIPLVLLAGLIVLNQSLFHGHDAVFGLYYRLPLACVVWLSLAWIAKNIFSQRFLFVSACLVFVINVHQMVQNMMTMTVPHIQVQSEIFRDLDAQRMMQILSQDSEPEIILAPIEISNLVPVLTPHYALFTQYAHYEYATDQDLSERYLLLQSFFPLQSSYTPEGHPLVFGLYAGNLFARTKILCKLYLEQENCQNKLSDYIPDQDVRYFVESGAIDQLALLRKFGVTKIISDAQLPLQIARVCNTPVFIGRYTIFDCDFTNETLSETES